MTENRFSLAGADRGARPLRAALYLRVSTSGRSRYGEAIAYDQNPAVQEGPLRHMAEQRGWTIAGVYCDRISGAKEKRPALDELMADARRGKFHVLMVWSFDRLSRSLQHFLAVAGELRQLGIDLVSYTQNFDTTTPMGKFCQAMFGALAELEREITRERIRAGLAFARAHGTKSGRPIGRPKKIFRRDLVPELRAAGLSWREIARRTGASIRAVRRVYQAAAEPAQPMAKTLAGHSNGDPRQQRSSNAR